MHVCLGRFRSGNLSLKALANVLALTVTLTALKSVKSYIISCGLILSFHWHLAISSTSVSIIMQYRRHADFTGCKDACTLFVVYQTFSIRTPEIVCSICSGALMESDTSSDTHFIIIKLNITFQTASKSVHPL